VGVISKGRLILVEDKAVLMHKLGRKQLTLALHHPLAAAPSLQGVAAGALTLAKDGHELVYTYDSDQERPGIAELLLALSRAGIGFKDLQTSQSSLEDIFVSLVEGSAAQAAPALAAAGATS
jgi:ABC-2 type transport system ATP-binding protein